jgi:Fic family protein
VIAVALTLQAEIPRNVDSFSRAPLQVLSHLHAVVATDFDPSQRGRLRTDHHADDPLRLPDLPSPAETSARISALARLLTIPTSAPALIVAGIAHAEVAAVRPFAWGSGLVARAMTRLVLAARGVDPDGLTVSEAGLHAAGRSRYVSALRGYQSATPEGLAEWLILHADAVRVGADESRRIFADLPALSR